VIPAARRTAVSLRHMFEVQVERYYNAFVL